MAGTSLGDIFRRVGMLSAAAALTVGMAGAVPARPVDRVPVILDTDIGDDIDDTWALVMLLRSPEFDIRLITTTYGKAEYRAGLIAKLLIAAGRTDVPVGLGAGGRGGTGPQAAWVEGFDLQGCAVPVREDGVKAMIDAINSSPVPITLISIGPSTTVAEALHRDPGIAARTHFVGMQGSIRKGYEGGPVSAEWNIKADIKAARAALTAPWKSMTITPLDTCGLVRLRGERFRMVRDCPNPLVRALMENYRLWAGKASPKDLTESSVLFDTAAVYLALPGPRRYMVLEDLKISIGGDGMMRPDPSGTKMTAATGWKDLERFEDFLVKRIAKYASMSAVEAARPGKNGVRKVAVTMDDLPVAAQTDYAAEREIFAGLLPALGALDIPITGFANEGKLLTDGTIDERKVDFLRAWLGAGFDLGNHTASHLSLNRTPIGDFERDVLAGERILRGLVGASGRELRYFRYPFLQTGRSLEVKAEMDRFLAEHGYVQAPVTIDNSEWIFAAAYEKAFRGGDGAMKEKIAREYKDYMLRKFEWYEGRSRLLFGREPSQILLVHANRLNADHLGGLLAAVRARGYRFTTLAEALEDEVYSTKETYLGPAGISWLDRWAMAAGKKKDFFRDEPRVPGPIMEYAGIDSE